MAGGAVDIDRRYPESGGQDLFVALGQAGQLAIAIGSPITTQENQHHPRIQMLAQPPRLSRLVIEGEIGNRHQLGL